MIQGQNQLKFSSSNNGKQISQTLFLFHQNIITFKSLLFRQNIDWGIDMDIFFILMPELGPSPSVKVGEVW